MSIPPKFPLVFNLVVLLTLSPFTMAQEEACVDTGIIGDGWGWDGLASCQLPVTVAAGACFDSAPVNDGWGWNGLASCVIEPAVLEGACVDTPPFDDNWGWDGVNSCLLVADTATSEIERITLNDEQEELSGHISNTLIMSENTRYLLFATAASNVIAGETQSDQSPNVFLRDTVSGSVTKISASINGQPVNNKSWPLGVSDDGRYIVFGSYASNVHIDANGSSQVYLYDALSQSTHMISSDSDGEAGRANSGEAFLSGDSSTVLYSTKASNLLPEDSGDSGIIIYDIASGGSEVLTMDSLFPYNSVYLHETSSDGRFLVLTAKAPGADATDPYDTYWYDRLNNELFYVHSRSTARTSVSDDGRYVLYNASIGDNSLIRHELETNIRVNIGVDTMLPEYVNSGLNKRVNAEGISSDGSQVLYRSTVYDGRIASTSDTFFGDLYIMNMADQQVSRLSQGLNQTQSSGRSLGAAFANDDKAIYFYSEASNLVAGDTNYRSDAFIVQNPSR